MGLLNRMINRNANVPQDPAATLGRGDVLPPSAGGPIATRGNAYLNKATDFYKQNPKLVGGIALVASALLLNRMKRPQ